MVDALTQKSDGSLQFACQRLGVILNSYTVYLDLVLADLDGNIVANGRPDQLPFDRANGSTIKSGSARPPRLAAAKNSASKAPIARSSSTTSRC